MKLNNSRFLLVATISFALMSEFSIGKASANPPDVDYIESKEGKISIHAVSHAGFVILAGKRTVFVDPVGGGELYAEFPKADLILITHTHGDHFDPDTIKAVKTKEMVIVGTADAQKQVPEIYKLQNGENTDKAGFRIEAIPAYNLNQDRLKFHPKGTGNGYILTINEKRFYISGDTEDIPEMRALKNIDVAFVCMNLPYTMTEQQAASAVLAFQPKVVYPYHYRGKKDGKPFFHDINKFKQLVSKNKNIEVRFLKWY